MADTPAERTARARCLRRIPAYALLRATITQDHGRGRPHRERDHRGARTSWCSRWPP